MQKTKANVCICCALFAALALSLMAATPAETLTRDKAPKPDDRWTLAQTYAPIHRFSTLFTAQDMRNRLSNEEGLEKAIAWCRNTAVTHVFLETFRDGYQVSREVMLKARERFKQAGFVVSGCVTPTKVGKASTGWKETISCYTDPPTQAKVKSIFEFTAGLFDEIMIDDFWFTDCACAACEAARKARQVTLGSKVYPVNGDTWEDYRCELMVQLSRQYVLAAAKKVNPQCKLIIKYPQWYDRFHDRGYEVIRETADFDRIWVGTETRDYADARWGGTVQYEAYFIMRWLGGIGGKKCGGGWYDWLGTTEKTYVEQARQTILAGARESLLFCYGGLQGTTGPKNVEALRENLPELLAAAKEVNRRKIIGIAAYKPANSHPENEARVFDFVGMLGLPLVPCHQFPSSAPAAFFSLHALKDPQFMPKLKSFVAKGKPVLLTDGLANRLSSRMDLNRANVHVLKTGGDPKSLLALPHSEVNAIREPFLKTLRTRFIAPHQTALYLFKDGSWVIENFNDESVKVELNGQSMDIQPRGWRYVWK